MTEAVFRKLVDRLHYKTIKGEIQWRTEDSKYYFIHFNKGIVRMMARPGDFDFDDYVITIYNENGDVTDEFTDGAIDVRDESNGLVYYPKMQEMYNVARRQITGADKVLNSIIDELE